MAMMMMGKHKMGQNSDVASMGGFMNPTRFNSVVKKGARRRVGKGNMGSMRMDTGNPHAHMGMGNMGSMRMDTSNPNAHMGMGMNIIPGMGMMMMGDPGVMRLKAHGMIAQGKRRLGNCNGLQGHKLGRCRASVRGGCTGLMGVALLNCKAHRRRAIRRALGGSWSLVKKNNGNCECTQNPRGQIVLGRYHSAKECEGHRSHDC